ncbi:MAG: hypothetical protein LKJ69_05000 [Lactobacillus sp.]|jgi:hypothetical protein|nr:hypothetical protein [Lactobacillus sp.]MCI2032742.1 hypothetical protein [Lactobacillus sp.]
MTKMKSRMHDSRWILLCLQAALVVNMAVLPGIWMADVGTGHYSSRLGGELQVLALDIMMALMFITMVGGLILVLAVAVLRTKVFATLTGTKPHWGFWGLLALGGVFSLTGLFGVRWDTTDPVWWFAGDFLCTVLAWPELWLGEEVDKL